MKNFGLNALTLISRDGFERNEAVRWASGADDLLERMRIESELITSLDPADVPVLVHPPGSAPSPSDLPPSALLSFFQDLPSNRSVALILAADPEQARRDLGTVPGEVWFCPLPAALSAAQQVAILGYELSGCSVVRATRPARPAAPDGVLERIATWSREIERRHDVEVEDSAELKRLMMRSRLGSREATLVLGILRQLEWKLKTGQ